MAFKIDEIMDMSLDDYIAVSKKSSNNAVNTTSSNNNNQAKSITLNKFGRRQGNIDDEDDDEELLYIQEPKDEPEGSSTPLNEDTGIWKAPDSSIDYIECHVKHNDLREKLNNSHNNNIHNNHGQLTTVQYRLMAPNNVPNRPRGIPTLLPLDAYVRQQPNNGQHNGHRRNKNRGYNNNNHRGGRGYNNNNNGNKNNTGGGGGGYINNGRIQRNRPNDMASKNLRFSVNPNDISLNNTLTSQPRNMVIETPSQYINLAPSTQLNSSFQIPQTSNGGNQSIPIGNLTPQAQAALNLNSNTNQQTAATNNNDSLKSLLGFEGNLTGEMMPVFASRLLDFIQNNSQAPVHKPMYDMKIQKDICEIQNKPLLYKCNGGEVVSSDGAGVNCKIIPRTSGVSLNCRFA